MKWVVFSNLWPPRFIGGYEIGASHVVSELKSRGHDVLLLSSRDYHLLRPNYYEHRSHTPEDAASFYDVGPCILGQMQNFAHERRGAFLRGVVRTVRARQRYLRAIREFRPDVLLTFNPVGVPAAVLDDFQAYSKEHNVPFCAYVSDHWLQNWPGWHPTLSILTNWVHSPRRSTRWFGRVMRKIFSKLGLVAQPLPMIDHYFYCSQFIREISREGSIAFAKHSVVPWGLPNIESIAPVPTASFRKEEPLTLVYAGQILEHKGLPVVLRALRGCQAKHRLLVIGDDEIDYALRCKQIAEQLGVAAQVQFLGRHSPDRVLSILREQGDVLVVPSEWDEPFSIVVLEGMGVGLPVIATRTGGTPEAITHGKTGFLFERGQDKELSVLLDQLNQDRELCGRIGRNARARALEHYVMRVMVDRMIDALCGAQESRLSLAA